MIHSITHSTRKKSKKKVRLSGSSGVRIDSTYWSRGSSIRTLGTTIDTVTLACEDEVSAIMYNYFINMMKMSDLTSLEEMRNPVLAVE